VVVVVARLAETVARRAVQRSVGEREAAYVRDVDRILQATYRLIERTGSVDPSLRDILRETKLSTQAFYRYFQSKDELMLVVLDDGRRQLVGYLEHRMGRASTVAGRVRAWIEGVLAQAADTNAASRTRPFVANHDRLVEAFPDEQRASVELLVGLLADALPGKGAQRRRDADAIYHLAFGTLHHHLASRTKPSTAEVDHIVRFALRAIGAGDE
jgi:AcrR family transcriptional regulator